MVTLDDAKIVASDIAASIKPELIIVFGSVARHCRGNDLDLLIVVDDHTYQGLDSEVVLQATLEKYYRKFAIEPFLLPASKYLNQYRSAAPFLNTVIKEGRVLYMANHVQECLRRAQEDLRTARYLAQGCFYRSACYHAQQALEKFLKARLIDKGWDLEKTHSIKRLIVISAEYGITYALSEHDIALFDSIYRSRYQLEVGLLPEGEPDVEHTARAIGIVAGIVGHFV